MPGVNLDFLSASEASQPLVGNPDILCAESGLEEVIGDLLAQDQAEEEEVEGGECGLELTLRCAVGEIHSDLQAFGKRVDARLEEAAARVAPLSTALAALQEENLRLRIQQERLARQVEALCQAMGLPEPPTYTAFVAEPTPNDLQLPPSTPLIPKTPDGLDWEPEAVPVPHLCHTSLFLHLLSDRTRRHLTQQQHGTPLFLWLYGPPPAIIFIGIISSLLLFTDILFPL